MRQKEMILFPEHDKLKKISEQSQVIGEFLDIFLPEQGIVLAEYEKRTEGVGRIGVNRLWPTNRRIQDLLAAFFEIDQDKLEQEKRAMLAEIRRKNA